MGFGSTKPFRKFLFPLLPSIFGPHNAGAVVNQAALGAFEVPAKLTIDQFNLVFSTTGANLRLGVYADNGSTPAGGKLLFQSQSQAITTNTTVSVSPALSLTPGLYWLAIILDNAAAVYVSIISFSIGVAYFNTVLDGCIYNASSFALQDPCPSVTLSENATPLFNARVASVLP